MISCVCSERLCGRSSPGMKVRLVANKVDLEATADQEVVEAAWQI